MPRSGSCVQVEETAGGRTKQRLLVNAFEAILGAIYLDGGLEPARRLVLQHAVPDDAELAGMAGLGPPHDYRAELEKLARDRALPRPQYNLTSETGPGHARSFLVEVRLGRESASKSHPASHPRNGWKPELPIPDSKNGRACFHDSIPQFANALQFRVFVLHRRRTAPASQKTRALRSGQRVVTTRQAIPGANAGQPAALRCTRSGVEGRPALRAYRLPRAPL